MVNKYFIIAVMLYHYDLAINNCVTMHNPLLSSFYNLCIVNVLSLMIDTEYPKCTCMSSKLKGAMLQGETVHQVPVISHHIILFSVVIQPADLL